MDTGEEEIRIGGEEGRREGGIKKRGVVEKGRKRGEVERR